MGSGKRCCRGRESRTCRGGRAVAPAAAAGTAEVQMAVGMAAVVAAEPGTAAAAAAAAVAAGEGTFDKDLRVDFG